MRPGQDTRERGEEIVECPCEDHIVVDVKQEHYHGGSQPNTCNSCQEERLVKAPFSVKFSNLLFSFDEPIKEIVI